MQTLPISCYKLQLTLEQHYFELHESTYTWIFFSTNLLGNFLEACDDLKKLADELHSMEISKNKEKDIS